MKHLALTAFVGSLIIACTAPKAPKAEKYAPKPTAKRAEKADTTEKQAKPKHLPDTDTTTTYTTSDGGMTQTESKLFAHATSMQAVYQETLRKGDIEDTEWLLPQLPKRSKEVDVGKNGLISVSYIISPKRAKVEMYYEGGVTTLTLREQSAGVKREITYSAD